MTRKMILRAACALLAAISLTGCVYHDGGHGFGRHHGPYHHRGHGHWR